MKYNRTYKIGNIKTRKQGITVKKTIAALCLLFLTEIAHASDQISMFVGEIKILEVGAIDRVAVGKGDLLSTTILENGQLLVLAEKAGETTVHIWYSDGAESDVKIQVLDADSNRIVLELRTLLADLHGVEVKEVGQKIFLTGTLNCIAGQEQCAEEEVVKNVLAAYQNVINLTRKQEERVPNILPSNKMVSMDVKITEFNTSKLTSLGIDWSNAINGPAAAAVLESGNKIFRPGAPAAVAPSFLGALPTEVKTPIGYFGIATELLSTINLLVQTGDAIILAEPKLSARSGGKADFLAGGEIPIVTAGGLGTTNVEFKQFGIILGISPVVDDENNIVATVSTEVSAVDDSIAVSTGSGTVPGFLTRKTSTEVSMHDKDTLVMSGLVNRDTGQSIDKFPILGDIPVLGELFKSTDWRNKLTELVIFVTPTVYDAKSQYNQERVNRRQELIETYKKNVDRGDLIIE